MIVDRLSNAGLYRSLSANMAKAFEYLQKTDLPHLAPGKYDIDGENVFALVQHRDTRLEDETQWEVHRKYADIQFMLEGTERMGYAHVAGLQPIAPLDEVKDIQWLRGKGDFVTVETGGFAIFYPEDAHMPSVAVGAPGSVKKVVVKVRV